MSKREARGAQGKFLELRAQGQTYEEIASELKVDVDTLVAWSQDLRHELGNRRVIRYEAVQEKAYATRERRAELIGERIRAIKAELEKRTLESLGTKDLEELLIKYTSLLNKDQTAVVFTVAGAFEAFKPEEWQG